MTESAGTGGRPASARGGRYRHAPVVLRGFDPVPDPPPVGSPGADFLGVDAGSYLIRLQHLEGPAFVAFERAAGIAGATLRHREEDAVVWLAASRLQLEALRNQLLAAPSEALRAAEVVAAALRAYHRQSFELHCGDRIITCGTRPLLMGIVIARPIRFTNTVA